MTQRNIINRAAVHLANLSTRLKPTTFFVEYTFVTRYGPTWGARPLLIFGHLSSRQSENQYLQDQNTSSLSYDIVFKRIESGFKHSLDYIDIDLENAL